MRVDYPAGQRSLPEDRNPIFPHKAFNAEISEPDATTQRFTYTVPANRRAIVHDIWTYIQRTDTNASIAVAGIYVQVVHNTVSYQLIYNMLYDNNIGARAPLSVNPEFVMEAGDQLNAYTVSDGDGGKIVCSLSATITEYDK